MMDSMKKWPQPVYARSNHTISSPPQPNHLLAKKGDLRFINYSPKTSFFDATKSNLTSVLPSNNAIYMNVRSFQNVGHYHNVADESLNSIQDAVEDFFEDHYDADTAEKEEDIPEVNYSSGVLTIYLPPHGTWVVNKQTPNEQIWWSSPLSGPRRYEYDDERERWVYSRVADEGGAADVGGVNYGEEDTLGGMLNKEFGELFGQGLGDDFHC